MKQTCVLEHSRKDVINSSQLALHTHGFHMELSMDHKYLGEKFQKVQKAKLEFVMSQLLCYSALTLYLQ